MKKTFTTTVFLLSLAINAKIFHLDSNIYNQMDYSSIYKKHNALVLNVDYKSVKQLISQIENEYNLSLSNRGEAHITMITPPEFSGKFNKNHIGLHDVFSIDEIHNIFNKIIQKTSFNIVCIGKRQNKQGHIVFFLVVNSPELFSLRKQLQKKYERRALENNLPFKFDSTKFWPHITIGFIKGDIHGVSKGDESCIEHQLTIF